MPPKNSLAPTATFPRVSTSLAPSPAVDNPRAASPASKSQVHAAVCGLKPRGKAKEKAGSHPVTDRRMRRTSRTLNGMTAFSAIPEHARPVVHLTGVDSLVKDEQAQEILPYMNWRSIAHGRKGLLEALAKEHGIPPKLMKNFVATVLQEDNRRPERKEEADHDVYSVRFNDRPVTLSAKLAANGVASDLKEPSLLNGLADGLDRLKSHPLGADTVRLMELMPKSRFVEVPLKQVPGDIVWVNWGLLAKAIALDDKMKAETRDHILMCCQNQHLTPELRKALLQRYCVQVDDSNALSRWFSGDKAPRLKGFADRYHGAGPNRGSARAVIPENSGVVIKGAGKIEQLLPPRSVADHATGLMGAAESGEEAVASDFAAGITEGRSTETLLIMAVQIDGDPDKETFESVRVGNHFRPGNALEYQKNFPLNQDVLDGAMERMHSGLSAQERRHLLVKGHAKVAAATREFRAFHGTSDVTNLALGSLIDMRRLKQVRDTGPLYTKKNEVFSSFHEHARHALIAQGDRFIFGTEHKAHLHALSKLFPDVESEWDAEFTCAKNVGTLSSCGFPIDVAESLAATDMPEVRQLGKALRGLKRWFHEEVSANGRGAYERSALTDVHALQTNLSSMFVDEEGNPKVPAKEELRAHLNLHLSRQGPPMSCEERWRKDLPSHRKYAVPADKDKLADVEKYIDASLEIILGTLPQFMGKVKEDGVQAGRWPDGRAFSQQLRSLAAFRNRHAEEMAPGVIEEKFAAAERRFRASSAPDAKARYHKEFADIIDSTRSASKLNVNDIMFNSDVYGFEDHGQKRYRLQMQKIDGRLHYLEAGHEGQRELCVEIPLYQLTPEQRDRLTGPEAGSMATWSAGQIRQTVGIGIVPSSIGEGEVVKVRLPTRHYQYESMVGELDIAGTSIPLGQGVTRYTYAVPDRYELAMMVGP